MAVRRVDEGDALGAWIEHVLHTVPPLAVYLVVAVIVMCESLGVPLPGEVALVTGSLLALGGEINPWILAACVAVAATSGDSIGFLIGKTGGRKLLDWAGRKWPKHFGPSHVAVAEKIFRERGWWAVFFGRFIALLRILAGPLAGISKMHYPKFLSANALGALCWSFGTVALITFAGKGAEVWLGRFSWIGLIAAIIAGLIIGWYIKRHTNRMAAEHEASNADSDAEERADTSS